MEKKYGSMYLNLLKKFLKKKILIYADKLQTNHVDKIIYYYIRCIIAHVLNDFINNINTLIFQRFTSKSRQKKNKALFQLN